MDLETEILGRKANEIVPELKKATLEENTQLQCIIGYLQSWKEKDQLDYGKCIEQELPK